MAALPVVSTNVGDCALVLDQGRCGRLVPPSDPEALAAAVVDLLDNPEEARRLAEALKGRVATHFSATSALDKIEKVYAKILSRSEEHTSELQSRPHLVCRLLLEKKNR